MSAAPGTEALDVVEPVRHPPTELLAVQHARRPRPVPRPQLPVGPSGAGDWVQALRLRSLPTALLGAAVVLLLVAAEPSLHVAAAAVGVTGLVVLHLLGALLQALADPRRHRAGPLRRVEAGRAVLGLAAVGVVLVGVLTAQRGWPALMVAAVGVVAVVLAARGSSGVLLPAATVASSAAVWWAATGDLPWQVLLAVLPVGLLVSALRAHASSRVLLAAPCAAVGLAVALHALPWPALLVAASLPATRRAAVSRRPADGPARFVLVLLLAGLVLALATGVDLPLTAPADVTDLLVAMLAVGLLGAAALALLAAVTVVPFVVTLQRADRLGVSTSRAGAVALAGSSVGLLAAVLLALRTAVPVPVAALPLLLVALGPVAVSAAPRWLGRRGRHEARAA